jgi:predicted enzyme related to lactoylglutathione lyase
MIRGARYVHTNLIGQDWRRLSDFYQSVLGCVLVPPQRNFAGAEVEAGTGVLNASLEGVHLRMPGNGDEGPTLEIFSYSQITDRQAPAANRPGFGHIAFAVDSVSDARAEVLRAGGKAVGEIVTLTVSPIRKVTWCYVTDPEGNIIELQSWSG